MASHTRFLTVPEGLVGGEGFSCDDFTYDHERDVYQCPGGTMLTTTGTLVNDGTTMLYRALQHECAGCALRPRC